MGCIVRKKVRTNIDTCHFKKKEEKSNNNNNNNDNNSIPARQ